VCLEVPRAGFYRTANGSSRALLNCLNQVACAMAAQTHRVVVLGDSQVSILCQSRHERDSGTTGPPLDPVSPAISLRVLVWVHLLSNYLRHSAEVRARDPLLPGEEACLWLLPPRNEQRLGARTLTLPLCAGGQDGLRHDALRQGPCESHPKDTPSAAPTEPPPLDDD
jgi:hypothetical protein